MRKEKLQCFKAEGKKMLKLLVVVAATILVVSARKFNNPVLDNADYPDPGAFKVGDTYYVVTTTNNQLPEKFPIHRSKDLNNWDLVGYVFNATNPCPWSGKDYEYWAPELHEITLPNGKKSYRVYFTSREEGVQRLTLGVAASDNVEGPYKSLDRPLYIDPEVGVLDCTLVNDNGTLYLVWKGKDWIVGRPLSADGLSFSSENTVQLFKPTLPWEDNLVEGPYYLRRGKYHYLFYSGHGMCDNLYVVGIARSLNVMGPYEKRPEPILRETHAFPGPGHNSVVKDLNDEDYVMIYHAWKRDHVCGDNPRLTLVANIGWDEDDWPYVYDID